MSEEDYTKWKCDSYNSTEGNLNKEDGYSCTECKNKGYVSFAKYDETFKYWSETQKECKCMRIRRAIRKLERSGLKNIIRDYTFDKYETNEDWKELMKKKAIDYVNAGDEAWLFMGGQSGCGKTHLCTAAAGCFLRKGIDVKYMLWRDDITILKSMINDSEYSNLISEYKTATVLYIDDLFKNGKDHTGKVQLPTGADVQIAFEIINYRYNNRKELKTIISSERTIYELVDIDEAVGGRIAEMSVQKGFGINIKKDMKKNYRLNGSDDI